jgi:predicted neuraminidase
MTTKKRNKSSKKTEIYTATIKVAVRAEACGSPQGACDWFCGLLSENEDVLDWGYVPENGVHPMPKLVKIDESQYKEGDLFKTPKDTLKLYSISGPTIGVKTLVVKAKNEPHAVEIARDVIEENRWGSEDTNTLYVTELVAPENEGPGYCYEGTTWSH